MTGRDVTASQGVTSPLMGTPTELLMDESRDGGRDVRGEEEQRLDVWDRSIRGHSETGAVQSRLETANVGTMCENETLIHIPNPIE